MYKLLSAEKVKQALAFCSDDVFSMKIAAGLHVYGADSRYIHTWYSENENGEIDSLMSMSGETLWASFKESADFEGAYALAALSGAVELIFDAKYHLCFNVQNAVKGDIMCANKANSRSFDVCSVSTEGLREIYAIVFEQKYGDFDRWYTETSHRIRHSVSTVFALYSDKKPLSCVTVLTENKNIGLITDVATLSNFRHRGYAAACVSTAVDYLAKKGKTALLLSADAGSSSFYHKCGFSVCSQWCKLSFEG